MRYLYTFLLTVLSPLLIVRLWLRSRSLPAYRQRLAERFGFFKVPAAIETPTIWVHAVSVGETLAAIPLIKALKRQYPDHALCVTTTTPTGSACLTQHDVGQALHVYLPYDLPWAVRRFIRKVRPRVAIMMETELWPNLYHQLAQQRVPIILANARLSPSAFQNYHRWRRYLSPMLDCISLVLAQTSDDAERYHQLGVPKHRIQAAGNIKFDLTLPPELPESSTELRNSLGVERQIWIAASTHEGEEARVLETFVQLKRTYPQLLLVLAPRHPDRFEAVAALCAERGLETVRRSTAAPVSPQTEVYLGDTLGELLLLYSVADVAFVGGSLVARGGHNLLEPASVSVATVTGPHMQNFQKITQLLSTAGGLICIENASGLTTEVSALLADPQRRQRIGQAGHQVLLDNRGALATHLSALQTVMTMTD